MILERMIFHLKFGKAKDTKSILKESRALITPEVQKSMRYMFDLTNPSNTSVMENTYENLNAMEKKMSEEMLNYKEWDEWYHKFIPLVDSSCREMYTIYELG